jgi:hypothetical protein
VNLESLLSRIVNLFPLVQPVLALARKAVHVLLQVLLLPHDCF